MVNSKETLIKNIYKKKIVNKPLEGRRLVYVFEPVEEITLELKKNLMFAGFLPYNYKNSDEMIREAQKRPPEVFIISTIDKNSHDIVKQIKNDEKLSDIFIVAASIYKDSEQASLEAGADFYIPMPYIWKKLPYLIRALTFINDIRQSDEGSLKKEDITITFSKKGKSAVEITF